MSRVFKDCKEAISEIYRDVVEMGIKVHPASMQNKVVKGDENFATLEITNYTYCLLSLQQSEFLFLHEDTREWVKAEFAERVDTEGVFNNPGKAWKLRPETWEQFLNTKGKFDYTYSERFNEFFSLDAIIDELILNPDSRQCILSVWDRRDIEGFRGRKRIPCSIYYQFLLREGKLSIIYNQRSADAVTHFGNDIALAWMLKDYVADKVGVESGYLHHNIGSLHVYFKDLNTLKKCVTEML